jgi:hypothetical protein
MEQEDAKTRRFGDGQRPSLASASRCTDTWDPGYCNRRTSTAWLTSSAWSGFGSSASGPSRSTKKSLETAGSLPRLRVFASSCESPQPARSFAGLMRCCTRRAEAPRARAPGPRAVNPAKPPDRRCGRRARIAPFIRSLRRWGEGRSPVRSARPVTAASLSTRARWQDRRPRPPAGPSSAESGPPRNDARPPRNKE